MHDLIGHSITYRVAIGPHAGQKVFTLHTVPAQPHEESRQGVAQYAGFSLHAGIGIEAHARTKLERLCRYVSRPAVAEERLALTAHGEVRYQLKPRIATAPRTSCFPRSTCWHVSPPSYPRRACISPDTTAYSPRMRRCALRSRPRAAGEARRPPKPPPANPPLRPSTSA